MGGKIWGKEGKERNGGPGIGRCVQRRGNEQGDLERGELWEMVERWEHSRVVLGDMGKKAELQGYNRRNCTLLLSNFCSGHSYI